MLIIELDQSMLMPLSILLGIILGFIYGIIKIIRCLFYHNNVILFFEDFVFCLFASVSFLILHYNCTFGVIRFYAFIGTVIGFTLYYFTLGKLTELIAVKIKKLIMPYIFMIKRHFLKFRAYIKYLIISKRVLHNAKKGFI